MQDSTSNNEDLPVTQMEEGARIYAIGDIHGRDDLLQVLLTAIEDELRDDPPEGPARVVFLGDYIDRGTQSRQVIDRLLAFAPDQAEVIFLKGNHEDAFLRFLEDASTGPSWANFGGIEMLASYGVKPPSLGPGADIWEQARQDMLAQLPEQHWQFFRQLKLWVYYAPYFFVHAGIDPSKLFSQQTERDFLWIREHFLNDERALPFQVVHGHTPVAKPYMDHRRISIDTCAYKSGTLTAARLDGRQVMFLHTAEA